MDHQQNVANNCEMEENIFLQLLFIFLQII